MKKDIRLILASTSPRRRQILEEMGLDFEIIPSDYEEVLENYTFTYEKIENLAYCKAKAVAVENDLSPLSIVLSADTVVVLENKILGKPKDEKEAFCMLKCLSGKKHSVVTSICALNPESVSRHCETISIDTQNEPSPKQSHSHFKKRILSTTSYVEFENLTDEQIKNYVENYNPLDKAGSYGIQELPKGFVKSVEGSFENIIGLCPQAVKEILKEFNYQG